ncbi:MAG: OmpH family outer membrane protein [Gemmatimonadota bacterium]
MRRASLAALAAVVLAAGSPVLAELKIGYIDSEVLRERLPEFKTVQRTLERLEQQYMQEANERQSRLVKLQEDFRRQELLMSEAKKTEMQAQFEESVQQLQQFTQEKLGPQGELFRKNVELSSPIFEKVNAALAELAKEEGYDFILDVAGNGVVVYADPERYNVTEKLIAKLDELREKQEQAQPRAPGQ